MAAVSDLIRELGKIPGLREAELRQVARSLQVAGMLPNAGMHRKRNPPPITSRHCAIFVIAVACSRTAGMRVPNTLTKRARQFMRLTNGTVEGAPETLSESLVGIIECYRDEAWRSSEEGRLVRSCGKLIFTTSGAELTVEIAGATAVPPCVSGKPARIYNTIYTRAGALRDTSGTQPMAWPRCADAFVMSMTVFDRLAELLDNVETAQAAA